CPLRRAPACDGHCHRGRRPAAISEHGRSRWHRARDGRGRAPPTGGDSSRRSRYRSAARVDGEGCLTHQPYRRCYPLDVGDWAIDVEDPRRDDVRALLEEHLRFAKRVTRPEGVYALDLDELRDPRV